MADVRENADGKGDFEATLTTLGWGVRRSIPHPVNFWPKLSKGPIAKFNGFPTLSDLNIP